MTAAEEMLFRRRCELLRLVQAVIRRANSAGKTIESASKKTYQNDNVNGGHGGALIVANGRDEEKSLIDDDEQIYHEECLSLLTHESSGSIFGPFGAH